MIQASAPKARLIVVANRLPVTPRRARNSNEWVFDRSSGGLVSAFLGVKNMEITWVGWVGVPVAEAERPDVTARLATQQPFSCIPVFLDAETADHFYNGFCNNVLWPLLHYIPLSMLDSQASVAELQWDAYQTANAAFADAVMSLELTDSDLVWVQDYHLMLLPRYLRERSPNMSIGWFLHTPFATSEMYRTLPHREEILRGVLGADLVRATLKPPPSSHARWWSSTCTLPLTPTPARACSRWGSTFMTTLATSTCRALACSARAGRRE